MANNINVIHVHPQSQRISTTHERQTEFVKIRRTERLYLKAAFTSCEKVNSHK